MYGINIHSGVRQTQRLPQTLLKLNLLTPVIEHVNAYYQNTPTYVIMLQYALQQ